MNRIFTIAGNNSLFAGIAPEEFEKMFGCLLARTQCFKKDNIILLEGDAVDFVGIIISGSVKIVNESQNGDKGILAELFSSELFGEVFACAEVTHSPVTVLSSGESEILFIDYKRIVSSCTSACPFHARLIENMLKILAKKNLLLNQKNQILSKRSTREKLMLFFDIQRGAAQKFTLPFNREELAEYLCVDRSAMSSELGKMKKDGLIHFVKNDFEIL